MAKQGEALAHVAKDGRVHLLEEHLRAVAAGAAKNSAAFDEAGLAGLAGLWHDLGKYADDFQAMLHAAGAAEAHVESEADVTARKRVDHSTAGAFHTAQRARECLPVAFAIAGHHAGLADHLKLTERLLSRGQTRLDAALAGDPAGDILKRDVPALPARLKPASRKDHDAFRRLELFTRMIFSALCDADFLDTEAFFDASRTELRGGHLALGDLALRLRAHVDGLGRSDTEVNRVRAAVREACQSSASHARGIFTLTVPTGGGKTLAAMEFALGHAIANGLRRVVVAIPYTSILEQNAAVYRRAFGLADDDVSVLEHHASIETERETARSRVATENWDPPIVVTTNVQLLESLFARRPGACRKLHNLSRAVIILDEAQTLPRGMLAPTTDVLDALVRDYGSTVVLCTATQPALTRSVLVDCGLEATIEIAPEPSALAERLRRVDVDWSGTRNGTTWDDLADKLANEADVLAIVHRRNDARELCAAVDARTGDRSTLHLSALMCPVHRKQVLANIRDRKTQGERVRVVSTQLVEAGVDLDFAVVYRALGGLDALAQAAGRCNREGRLEGRGVLHVFLAPTSPPEGILTQGLEVARAMLAAKRDGLLDLFSPSVHAEYFARLYRAGGDDVHDERHVQRDRAELSFEKVASSYRIVDDDWSAPLVVPLDERARSVLTAIEHAGPSRGRMRELGRVTINVSKKDLATWVAAGAVRVLGDGMVHALVGTSAYDSRFGLVPDRVGSLAPSDSIV